MNHPPTVVHLGDANADVTLSLSYGELLAIDDAANAVITYDPETNEPSMDGRYISARRTASLVTIPKTYRLADGGAEGPVTLEWVKTLSVTDGRALMDAVNGLIKDASAPNDEASPKGPKSKRP